jgi:hypothetical protein
VHCKITKKMPNWQDDDSLLMLFVTNSNRFGCLGLRFFLLSSRCVGFPALPVVDPEEYFSIYYFFLCLFVCYFAVANEKHVFLNKK